MKKILFVLAVLFVFAIGAFAQYYEINGSSTVRIGREINSERFYNEETQRYEYRYEYDYNDFSMTYGTTNEDLYLIDENGKEFPDDTVTWTSSNKNIVKILGWGYVEAVGAGTATITAKHKSGLSDTIKITVQYPKEIKIGRRTEYSDELDINDFTLEKGYSKKLRITDENGNQIDELLLKWSSSDDNIINILNKNEDEEDFIIAKAAGVGTATITASLPNGLSDTIRITVPNNNINIALLKYNPTTDSDEYIFNNQKINITRSFDIYALDGNGQVIDNENLEWYSSDKSVIEINYYDEGRYIVAKGIGTAKITVNAYDSNIFIGSDSIEITVEYPKQINIGRPYCDNYKQFFDDFELELNKEELLLLVDEKECSLGGNIITWSSSDIKVVEVVEVGDGYINIKAVGEGTATITASIPNGLSDTIKITVPGDDIPVTGVELDKTDITVNVGDITALKATVKPTNATNQDVEWKSSNTNIVKVNAKGEFKAYKPGKASVSVRTKDGKFVASCNVTVKDSTVPVTGVELDKTSITVNVGDITALKATVKPTNATNKDVEWKSSNTNIVKVNAKGEFKAYKAGKATVSVRTKDGKFVASCKVTVKDSTVPVTGVELDKTSITVNVGDITALKATVKPTNATNKDVEWKSSNTSIVKVNAKGEFKAYKAGKATVSVRTKDGKFIASCKVTVKDSTIPVTGVELDKTSITVSVGDITALKATVKPTNATNQDVEWKSSNTNIVKVNAKGEFKAYKAGNATVSVRTKDGKFVASCKVTVK